MSSQILSYKRKSKILKQLENIQNSSNFLNSKQSSCNQRSENNSEDLLMFEKDQIEEGYQKHEFHNSFFPNTFDFKRLVKEVESISWTINKPLAYYSYSLKNLISVTDQHVTGGSKALENYVSPFTATIYNSLKNAGAINIFSSNLDEFGMSGTGLDSAFGQITNPYDKNHMIGGSSSGSAYVVAKDMVDFAIGSDTGDSGRIPASNSHVFGFKPTYGIVSRFGFFPFCSQFDTPAIFSKDIETISMVLSVISHEDPKDLSTKNTEKINYQKYINKDFKKKIKIAIFNETFDLCPNNHEGIKNTEKEFNKMVSFLQEDENFEICKISFEPELLKLFVLIYMVISYSESISNYSNINGLLFPFTKNEDHEIDKTKNEQEELKTENKKIKPIFLEESSNFEELLINARKNFGREVKFRQCLGMYFLDGKNYDEIYLQAKKLMTVINDKIKKLFEEYDAVLSPTSVCGAKKIEEYKKKYEPTNIQNIILIPNFCGLPAISMPWIFDNNLPVGLHLFCGYKNDGLLLQITSHIQKHINKHFPNMNKTEIDKDDSKIKDEISVNLDSEDTTNLNPKNQ